MSEPQAKSRKNLKRPRGLLGSKKNADPEPSAKKPRPSDPEANLDPEIIKVQDWNDLKELYENALDAFYGENPGSALPLVRGVLHECARLVSAHEDPTIIYSPLDHLEDTEPTEFASSFYTIYASAWYLMYHFARTDSSVLAEGEPEEPVAYLISALKACEDGQKALGVRKQDRAWDLELIWGRLLIGAAQSQTGSDDDGGNEPPSPDSKISQLAGPDIPTILRKGMDRIFHAVSHRPTEFKSLDEDETKTQNERYARTMLFTAQDVLALAENLDQESGSSTSQFDETFFKFAQELFSHVLGVSDTPEVIRAQGTLGEAQVLLAMGAAIAERLEGNETESGGETMKNNAINLLKTAITKFESVREQNKHSQINEESEPLFLEALVTLANILPEGEEQDTMYERYRAEGGVLDGYEEETEDDVE
ncbi:translation initiation factor IF-2 [Ceratobasidium sp. AG-Ba]|nr:translation initiation factor IF-2 [Ceratobasidium sp. AG-Ba]